MGLSRSQLKELEDTIRARFSALQAEIHQDAARAQDESYAAIAGSVTDPADKSVAHLLADLGKAEVSRDLNEVRALEAALLRLGDGSYGRCSDCGGDIGLARLQVTPVAARCIDCQTRHEKTHDYPGEPRL